MFWNKHKKNSIHVPLHPFQFYLQLGFKSVYFHQHFLMKSQQTETIFHNLCVYGEIKQSLTITLRTLMNDKIMFDRYFT